MAESRADDMMLSSAGQRGAPERCRALASRRTAQAAEASELLQSIVATVFLGSEPPRERLGPRHTHAEAPARILLADDLPSQRWRPLLERKGTLHNC